MSIGHSPDIGQWTPDMRKSEDKITEADKQDAKRRIQGNLGMEQSPSDSGEEQDHEEPKRKASTVPTMDTFAASAM
ncbi:hypothetical protein E4U40_007207 [Claviceps sp. LM458 group G5]|nr:hypothetical protein E4U40_007207 [Claviceps sp. LM458 group G5]